MYEDVVVSKVYIAESRTDYLLSSVKPEPCDSQPQRGSHERNNSHVYFDGTPSSTMAVLYPTIYNVNNSTTSTSSTHLFSPVISLQSYVPCTINPPILVPSNSTAGVSSNTSSVVNIANETIPSYTVTHVWNQRTIPHSLSAGFCTPKCVVVTNILSDSPCPTVSRELCSQSSSFGTNNHLPTSIPMTPLNIQPRDRNTTNYGYLTSSVTFASPVFQPNNTSAVSSHSSTSISSTEVPVFPTDIGSPDGLLWSRAHRTSDGSLVFPGIGRTCFSTPSNVLRQIRSMASSEDSLFLQLPPTALIELTQSSKSNLLLNVNSRKGFHVCLCCRQQFTTAALYESHLNRPVARIFYRCHLCRGSETAHLHSSDQTSLNNMNSSTSTDCTMRSSGTLKSVFLKSANGTHFNFYSILPGGIIKTSNQCAIYAHMAMVHGTNVNSWTLLPSLFTICPLEDSAWSPSVSMDLFPSVIADPNLFYDLIANNHSKIEPKSNASILPTLSMTSSNNSTSSTSKILKPTTTNFYQSGMELLSLWCDFQHTLNNTLEFNQLNFLEPDTSALDSFSLVDRIFNKDNMLTNNLNDDSALATDTADTVGCSTTNRPPSLPSSGHPIYQAILRLARMDLWTTHLFLTNWCQTDCSSYSPSTKNRWSRLCTPPPSLTTGQLNQIFLAYLRSSELMKSAPPLSATTTTTVATITTTTTNNDNNSSNSSSNDNSNNYTLINNQPHPITSDCVTFPVPEPSSALLRCLMCTFRTNESSKLSEHLCGIYPTVHTKCALCGQLLCINQLNLCSVKAHLLLHLGCFLMCPQCGFTPPAYLPPDATELCLRIHLRFMCFHYNLIQIYQCHLCDANGKGYHTLYQLFQHHFEMHIKQKFACQWCVRRSGRGLMTDRLKDVQINSPKDRNKKTKTKSYNNAVLISDQPSTGSVLAGNLEPTDFQFVDLTSLLSHLKLEHDCITSVPIDRPKQGSNPNKVPNTTLPNSFPTKSSHGQFASIEVGRNSSSGFKSTGGSINLFLNLDYSIGYECPECKEISPTKEVCYKHFSTAHSYQHVSTRFYRCFGPCKFLCSKVQELRAHIVTCSNAQLVYRATFGNYKFGTSFTNEILQSKSTMETTAPTSIAMPSTSLHNFGLEVTCSGNMKLCFCSYCDIGSRRIVTSTQTVGDTTQSTSSGSSFSYCTPDKHRLRKSTDVFNHPIAVVNDDGVIATHARNSPVQQSMFDLDPVYSPKYFSDLQSLHNHEKQMHYSLSTNQIACPWCGKCLSGNLDSQLLHLISHSRENRLASWYFERLRLWNRNPQALLHCVCGVAVLDSPLAIIMHASTHILYSNKLAIFQKSPHLTQLPTSKYSHTFVGQEFRVFPKPGDHIPCPVNVYRHLRLALFFEHDYYLNHAALLNYVFACPICKKQSFTRWALTEHAFCVHWGVLCFICCEYQLPTVDSIYPVTDILVQSSSASINIPINHSYPAESKVYKPIRRSTKLPGIHRSSTCNGGDRVMYENVTVPNFWNHVYDCMMKRNRLVTTVNIKKSTNKDDLTMVDLSTSDDDDLVVEDDVTKSSSVVDAARHLSDLDELCTDNLNDRSKEIKTFNNDVTESASPVILITSSPESPDTNFPPNSNDDDDAENDVYTHTLTTSTSQEEALLISNCSNNTSLTKPSSTIIGHHLSNTLPLRKRRLRISNELEDCGQVNELHIKDVSVSQKNSSVNGVCVQGVLHQSNKKKIHLDAASTDSSPSVWITDRDFDSDDTESVSASSNTTCYPGSNLHSIRSTFINSMSNSHQFVERTNYSESQIPLNVFDNKKQHTIGLQTKEISTDCSSTPEDRLSPTKLRSITTVCHKVSSSVEVKSNNLPFFCCECQVPFISEKSLMIHRAAAHSQRI